MGKSARKVTGIAAVAVPGRSLARWRMLVAGAYVGSFPATAAFQSPKDAVRHARRLLSLHPRVRDKGPEVVSVVPVYGEDT
jgi:hypothetical protein